MHEPLHLQLGKICIQYRPVPQSSNVGYNPYILFIDFFFKGRALSRAKSRRNLDYMDVLNNLEEKGISIRVASPKLVMEEAPQSYKNVTDVVNTCKYPTLLWMLLNL